MYLEAEVVDEETCVEWQQDTVLTVGPPYRGKDLAVVELQHFFKSLEDYDEDDEDDDEGEDEDEDDVFDGQDDDEDDL